MSDVRGGQSVRKLVSTIPVIGPFARLLYGVVHPLSRVQFRNSAQYWEDRYRVGGTSGAGSYGRLALFKAEILNDIVKKHDLNSVIEWGCGDGAQLSLANYDRYIGIDISTTAIKTCRQKYAGDATKKFILDDGTLLAKADVALSLDVIYHLIEDEVFDRYMQRLFDSANQFVVIYSSNRDDGGSGMHVRHRAFTDWVEAHRKTWRLLNFIPIRFPFQPEDPENTSFADFYVFAPV